MNSSVTNGDSMDGDGQDASTRVIAQRVRQLRRQRDWSAEHLAEEMTSAGVGWNRGVITKLENGRRATVSVEELCALSYVFKVSPLDLLTPDHRDVPGTDAYRWALNQLSSSRTPSRLMPGDVIAAKVGDEPIKLTVVEVGTSDDSPEDVLRRYRLARGGA